MLLLLTYCILCVFRFLQVDVLWISKTNLSQNDYLKPKNYWTITLFPQSSLKKIHNISRLHNMSIIISQNLLSFSAVPLARRGSYTRPRTALAVLPRREVMCCAVEELPSSFARWLDDWIGDIRVRKKMWWEDHGIEDDVSYGNIMVYQVILKNKTCRMNHEYNGNRP